MMKKNMPWHCIGCHNGFQGPTDHTPKDGCPNCGSSQIFDCNVELVDPKDIPADAVFIPLGSVGVS